MTDLMLAETLYQEGTNYLLGIGVEADFDRGMDLLSQAIELGSTDAMITLGEHYEHTGYIDEDPALDARALDCFQGAADRGNALALGRIAQFHQVRGQHAESFRYWESFFAAISYRSQADFDMLEPASTIFDFLRTRGTTRRWFREALDPSPIPAVRLGFIIRAYRDGIADIIAAKRRVGGQNLSADRHLQEARAYRFIARCFEGRI